MSYVPNPDVDLTKLKFHFVRTLDDFLEMKRWMSNQRYVLGVDVETTGLDWAKERVRLLQFGDHTGGWACPTEGWEKPLGDLLNEYEGPIVLHNSPFDLHYLNRFMGYKPKWDRIHDTLTQTALLDPPGNHQLKPLAARHVSPYALVGKNALEDLFKKTGWWWDTVPVDHPTYWTYGVMDTCLTALLFEKLDPVMDLAGLRGAYLLERQVAEVIFEMERIGLAIDRDFIAQAQQQQWDNAERLRDVALRQYGVKELGSMMPCIEAFQREGIPLYMLQKEDPKTKERKLSLAKDVLEEIPHPLAGIIRQFRRSRMIAGNFLRNTLEAGDSYDGYVHCGINQHQAKTHRMSITRPALQQQMRIDPDDPTSRVCRDAFVARDGHLMVSCDFSNVEARLFADHANEPGMIDAIRRGIDLHCYTAQQAYGLPELPSKKDPRRQIAKNTLFCLLYGGGPGKIAVTAKITFSEAEDFVGKLFHVFPGIEVWQKGTIDAGRWRRNAEGVAYVELSDGRKLTLSPADDRDYALANFAIQGEAGVLFKRKMIAAKNAGLMPYMRLPIHDEILCEAPADIVEEVGRTLSDVMADEVRYRVPIAAEMSPIGSRWGDCK